MIRDVTGVNEVLDGSTPKADALVGVRQQQMAAGNNAINDITNGASVLYKRVCDDVVKCLQVLPPDSIIYEAYERAIGTTSMEVLSSFASLPLHNYGVIVEREMSDEAKLLLEQNIQQSLAQREMTLRTLWQSAVSKIWTKRKDSSSSDASVESPRCSSNSSNKCKCKRR